MKEKIDVPDVSGWMFLRLTTAFAVILVGAIALGAVLPVLFWSGWQWLFGSIPKVMGFSRFWLDAIFAGPCTIAVIIYGVCLLVMLDSKDYGPKSILFRTFTLIWVADIIVSIAFSAAVGLAIIITLAIIVGISWTASSFFQLFGETQGLTERPEN